MHLTHILTDPSFPTGPFQPLATCLSPALPHCCFPSRSTAVLTQLLERRAARRAPSAHSSGDTRAALPPHQHCRSGQRSAAICTAACPSPHRHKQAALLATSPHTQVENPPQNYMETRPNYFLTFLLQLLLQNTQNTFHIKGKRLIRLRLTCPGLFSFIKRQREDGEDAAIKEIQHNGLLSECFQPAAYLMASAK